MRSKTWVWPMARVPLMTSLIRPWPRPTAVAMRIWLSPVYWHEQPEQRAHVALAQRLADVGAFPEGGRYRRGVECAWPHGVPSIVPSPGARVTGCDQQLTRLHVISL